MKKQKNENQKNMDAVLEWTKKYQREIIDIGEGRLDVDIFITFLRLLNREGAQDSYIVLGKHLTNLSIEIMIYENRDNSYPKTPLVVVCLDEKRVYAGVVSIDNTQYAVFTDEKYKYLQNEISLWIGKYKSEIEKVADNKMEVSEFAVKLEHDKTNN
ncbi:MAG: hypothetical protein FWH18_00030 [Marinilabiliaceae bacterium]|nr:hypothetical protein [Marinilabiliaceae bacterium]